MCHHCRFVQEEIRLGHLDPRRRPAVGSKVIPDMSKQFANAGEAFKDAKFDYTVTFTDWNMAPEVHGRRFRIHAASRCGKSRFAVRGNGRRRGRRRHPLLGQPAPPFETTDVDDHPIDLKSRIGQERDPARFLGHWCGPCVQAMPKVDAVAKKFADKGLVFRAVNVRRGRRDDQGSFSRTRKLEVPVALDPEGRSRSRTRWRGFRRPCSLARTAKCRSCTSASAKTSARCSPRKLKTCWLARIWRPRRWRKQKNRANKKRRRQLKSRLPSRRQPMMWRSPPRMAVQANLPRTKITAP